MVITSLPTNSSNVSVNPTLLLPSSDSEEFRVVKLFLYAVIFAVSVIGNVLVCIIVVRHRRMRTITNYFVLNLAVADLAVTCICIPFDIPVQENQYRWPYGAFLCRTIYPLQTMAMFASIFTLMAVSLNRFCAIVYPFKTHMTKRQAKKIILGIWALSSMLVIPYSFVLRLDEETMSCEEKWPDDVNYRKAYTLSLFLVQYVIPLSVIAIAYLRIAREMHKCVRQRKTSASGCHTALKRSQQMEGKRVVRMLVVVTVLFAVCVLPNNIMWLWLDFGDGKNYKYFWNMVAVSNIILFANSAANPIAYTICHEKFRDEFRRYIYFSCGSKKRGAKIEKSYKSSRSSSYANGLPFNHPTSCYSTALSSIQLILESGDLKRKLSRSPETDI
ncbi:orexin receptor type 2-like [Montipora capricornis]|uniref:orexin receptor type 2-like n=1 Tax=Montipora foliosa TaxID=591990 RepID=UPI0035F174D3